MWVSGNQTQDLVPVWLLVRFCDRRPDEKEALGRKSLFGSQFHRGCSPSWQRRHGGSSVRLAWQPRSRVRVFTFHLYTGSRAEREGGNGAEILNLKAHPPPHPIIHGVPSGRLHLLEEPLSSSTTPLTGAKSSNTCLFRDASHSNHST